VGEGGGWLVRVPTTTTTVYLFAFSITNGIARKKKKEEGKKV